MTLPKRISYAFVAVTLFLVGWLHLTTPVITVMFSMFALESLHRGKSKTTAVLLFLLLVTLLFYLLTYYASHAYRAFPRIADAVIPQLIDFAQSNGFQLPFDDAASFKQMIMEEVKGEMGRVGYYAKTALWEFAAVVIGVVVAISMFFNAKFDLGHDQHAVKDNLYSLTGAEVAERFRTFYKSFVTVMGAQLLISGINTTFTAIFLFVVSMKFRGVLIAATFFCGLLPIVGNIVSNTLIVAVALGTSGESSTRMALMALVFLIVIHKLEYFLNSKIIGDRIKNPMWLTLLGLVLGERLMGIPGMILAPVVLHYIKVEASMNKVESHSASPAAAAPPPA